MAKTAKAASAETTEKKASVLEFAEKKKKANKDKKSGGGSGLGSSRGIESMLRNSYRAQLDMIALAATKANIMMSVNGSLLALLTLSSAFILASEPRLLIPTTIFLLTCIVSIFFAVLAARPQKAAATGTTLQDFREDRSDLLVFEHFVQLSKDEYMTAMTELMHDKDRVYRAMVAHLYFLGVSADRRFKLLRVSYNSFIIGLISTVAAFGSVAIVVYR